MTLTLKFDLLVKNFNHGLYLMMVAARQASLSSDNSCLRNHAFDEFDCKLFKKVYTGFRGPKSKEVRKLMVLQK